MNVCDWYLFQGVINVIGFQRIVRTRLTGLPPDESAIAAAIPEAHLVLAELSRLLGDKSYFVGNDISLADLLVVPQLDFLARTPEWTGLSAKYPSLASLLDRMSARESIKATTRERLAERWEQRTA